MAIGDFDKDGLDDIVTANAEDPTISLFRSRPDGGFSTTTKLLNPGTASSARGVIVADVNSDGFLDVVAAAYPWTVRTLTGDGTGTFADGALNQSIYTPSDLACGDLNADGSLDLVLPSEQNGGSGVLLGNGTGSFSPGPAASALNLSARAGLVDLTGDGKLDLLTLTNGLVTFSVGTGAGTFGPPTGAADGGLQGRDLAVADFNGDGHLDIVSSNQLFEVHLQLGRGGGVFDAPRAFLIRPFSGEASATAIAAIDVDGDGIKDLVVGNGYHQSIEVLLSRCY